MFKDGRGTLAEVYREEWGVFGPPKQCHVVRSLAGTLRGVHVDNADADYLFVADGPESRQIAINAQAAGVSLDIAGLHEDVDGYVVATPTASHAAVIEELLPSEKPIFVEKPMTNDVGAARSLVERAAKRIFVMDKWRYHPGVEALAAANPLKDVDAIWILLPHHLAITYEILGYLPAVKAVSTPVPPCMRCVCPVGRRRRQGAGDDRDRHQPSGHASLGGGGREQEIGPTSIPTRRKSCSRTQRLLPTPNPLTHAKRA